MIDLNPEKIAHNVWNKLLEYKRNPGNKMLTDGEILANMIANGTITLEELNIAFDVRKNKNKSR